MLVSPINALDNGLALTPPSKLLDLAIALLFHEILTVDRKLVSPPPPPPLEVVDYTRGFCM